MGRDAPAAAEVDLGRLSRYIGYQLRQAQSAIFRDLAGATRRIGVTPGEFSLLALLERNPDLNPITLARIYQLDKATLSIALKRLAQRKLIRSAHDARDGRYRALALTAAGRATLRRATRRIEAQERAIDAVLRPGEREQLLELLQRVASAFDRRIAPPAGR